MKLKDYVAEERGRISAIAKDLGAHAPDVSRWCLDKDDKNYRAIPFHFGADLEKVTNGIVSRKDNFEDWARLWPELVNAA